MSGYQFHEFVAVDRPLGDAEFAVVRALSTRARMSRTHFVNDYRWGDFEGNPRTLVERYYDAHLYFASWGTRHLMLKLAANLLGVETAARYEVAPPAEVRQHKGSTILSFSSEDEEPEGDDDLDGALSGPIAELAGGDLRPRYLAWLAGIGTRERDEDTFDDAFDGVREPPLPAGLSTRRFHGPAQPAETTRTVAELLDAAAERRRHRAEADRRARTAAQQHRAEKAARAREQYLTTLAADPESAWLRVDALIAAKKPRAYDQAVELLHDLRHLSQQDETTDQQFADHVARIRDEHARKPSLIARLDHVGLGHSDPRRSQRVT